MAGRRIVRARSANVRFIMNSGATEHKINDERLLENVKVLDKSAVISTAKSDQVLRATKSFKIRLNSIIGWNKITPITLYSLIYSWFGFKSSFGKKDKRYGEESRNDTVLLITKI